MGKSVPNDTGRFYPALKEKELALVPKVNSDSTSALLPAHYKHIEQTRVNWKYFTAQLSHMKYQQTLNQFAIPFIYESNAIEGSRLSQKEVEAIVRKQYAYFNAPDKGDRGRYRNLLTLASETYIDTIAGIIK